MLLPGLDKINALWGGKGAFGDFGEQPLLAQLYESRRVKGHLGFSCVGGKERLIISF
jgi:hypothetical protein